MTESPTAAGPSKTAEPAAIELTEFCLRHSRVERSVELLNAFFAVESHAGRTVATESDFITRLAAFAAKPAA